MWLNVLPGNAAGNYGGGHLWYNGCIMKILDGHIHLRDHFDDSSILTDRMTSASIGGGVILSQPPGPRDAEPMPAEERVAGVLKATSGSPELYPFFWIDPIGKAAADEVAMAVDAGVSGFKVICSDFYPGDARALDTYKRIARAAKPILFHSGILWDGRNSSKYNRPAEFEALIDVDGLKFALAHISWPWCDEHIAVYGKFLNAKTDGVEMFIDTTPGTPRIYRREALTKVFTVGYDVVHNVFFGSDCHAPDYGHEWAAEWVARDTSILQELGMDDYVLEHVFSKNLERFLGVSDERVERNGLRPAE